MKYKKLSFYLKMSLSLKSAVCHSARLLTCGIRTKLRMCEVNLMICNLFLIWETGGVTSDPLCIPGLHLFCRLFCNNIICNQIWNNSFYWKLSERNSFNIDVMFILWTNITQMYITNRNNYTKMENAKSLGRD